MNRSGGAGSARASHTRTLVAASPGAREVEITREDSCARADSMAWDAPTPGDGAAEPEVMERPNVSRDCPTPAAGVVIHAAPLERTLERT